MKLAMHERDGAAVPAVVLSMNGSEAVVDIATALQLAGSDEDPPGSLPALFERWPALSGPLRKAAALIESDDDPASSASSVAPAFATTDIADARLLPPVGPGQLIVCCGFNYASHEAEVAGSAVGATWFIKNANSAVGSGAPIIIPPDHSDAVDYEGELALVFGKACHRVTAAEALDYVGGYTLVNDVSARLHSSQQEQSTDDIKRSVIDTHLGKQHPTFCPIGPVLVTADEIPDPSRLSFTTMVNGVVVQKARLRDMRLAVPELIEWLSTVFAFRPGDVISTGSPSGSGVSQKPPRFLKPADVVTITAPEIGELTNPVHERTAL
jgi:2-keto-4-pentenoate hydratase/2-oxohepta-3-ene-1,7-dioic acid hydratase in catechol pathway